MLSMNWITKKRIIFLSLLSVSIYIISYYNKILDLPYFYRDLCCVDDRIFNAFLIFVPFFVFTCIFVYTNESLFYLWKKFTTIYLTLYFVLYFLVPIQGDGLIWFQRETISMFGSIVYSVVSLLIIIYKSFKKD